MMSGLTFCISNGQKKQQFFVRQNLYAPYFSKIYDILLNKEKSLQKITNMKLSC